MYPPMADQVPPQPPADAGQRQKRIPYTLTNIFKKQLKGSMMNIAKMTSRTSFAAN